MRQIFKNFNKKLIPALPCVQFDGRIIVVRTVADCDKAVDYLFREPVLGFDTETRPSFHKGKSYKVSLLQISTLDTCFLFRLNYIGIPESLVRLLQTNRSTIIGLSLRDDFMSLRKRADFEPGDFVELQEMVKTVGIEDMSLQKIYANLFRLRISKSQRLSNWEADVLSDKQQMYAATDAWACIKIYNELKYLRESHDFELVVDEGETTLQ